MDINATRKTGWTHKIGTHLRMKGTYQKSVKQGSVAGSVIQVTGMVNSNTLLGCKLALGSVQLSHGPLSDSQIAWSTHQ